MFDFINYGADKLILLLLVIIRTSGLFIMAPVIGDRGIPTLIKVGLVMLLALVLIPTMPGTESFAQVTSVWQLAGLAFNELLVGFIIGLCFRLIFIGVLTAGSVIGYQIGFMFATMFDTNLSNQVSIIGRFWYVLAILFFLAINGHHLIINAFAESYQVIPAGGAAAYDSAGELVIKYTAYIFVIALKVASPIMISLFLTDVSLGVIAKTMPTMNVFFVGFPVKIGVGLVVMALSLPLFTYVVERAMGYFDTGLREILLTIAKA
ncbi:MAG: flagellar biosynthetic protein FliR [Candidatus Zixiibacteriota bacterium]|nr:MAG: flagellar biosynthetic protein FliR [candidate division Zixibacteria bacterium]